MSDQSNSSSPPPNPPRRMSISAIFAPLSNTPSANASSPPNAGVPATPDATHHRRGMSISTLGLGGSGNGQSSPYSAFARQRRASISTSSAASSPEFRNSFGDEQAVIEEDDKAIGSPPSPSFARGMSFGAQALKDVRQGSVGAPPNRGEGFNWSEALRDRTKRTPSFSAGNPFGRDSNRTKSTAVPAAPEPPKEMPKPTPTSPRLKKPDHMGERMLRGDFMMD